MRKRTHSRYSSKHYRSSNKNNNQLFADANLKNQDGQSASSVGFQLDCGSEYSSTHGLYEGDHRNQKIELQKKAQSLANSKVGENSGLDKLHQYEPPTMIKARILEDAEAL